MLEEKKFDVAEASEILWKEDVKPKLFGQFNKAVVAGKLEPEIRYSYTRNNKMFYCTAIRSRRISGTYDVIPVIISNEILEQRDIYVLNGKTVELDGEFWSSNRDGHLNLFLFVKGIEICEDEIEFIKNTNIIYLNGYVCKPSVYRLTPLGKSITDLIIAVNRSITVKRKNNREDVIPVIISDEVVRQRDIYSFNGKLAELDGEFRSSNYGGHLILSLFVKGIEIYEKESDFAKNKTKNIIYLKGYICKPTEYRTTFSENEITDFMIAINRAGKSDYIPCISWNKVAKAASKLVVSDQIELYGRIRSREYSKKIYFEDGYSEENRMVNEISVIRFQRIY